MPLSTNAMCNSQKPKSTDEPENEKAVDANDQDKSDEQSRSDTDDQNQSELKMAQSLSPQAESNNGLPHIPFSSTFGKAEKLQGRKTEQLRLSLDSQTQVKRRTFNGGQRLRRRARSSEGYVLRKDRIEFFDDSPFFEEKRKEGNAQYSSFLSPTSRKIEVGEKKTHNSITGDRNDWSNGYFHNNRPKTRGGPVIPLEHPFKIVWDVLTVVLSIAHSYLTHTAIRDRRFEASPFISFCQAWFLVDILLNFFTERKTSTGEIISDPRRIVARYLTSWFAVDILSLVPWEVLYVKPLIDVQNRRGFFKKSFFRSKAVVRVTRHLRGRHFRWFGTVAKHTKHHGVGAQRLLRLIIKYVPKYVMFLRNMKGVVAMRILRFVHWLRRSFKNMESKTSDGSSNSPLSSRDGQKRNTPKYGDDSRWVKNDDDGVPL